MPSAPPTEDCTALKDISKILLYLIGTVLFGAAVTPLLYWGSMALAAHGRMAFLAKVDFHSYFDRGVLIAALALLYLLARALKIESRASLDLPPNPHWRRDLGLGLVVALVSAAALIGWAITVHAWTFRPAVVAPKMLLAFLTAAVVSCLEEGLFRGALQGAIQRTAPKAVALVFVAALFAVVHFLKPPDHALTGPVTWASGFVMIPLAAWRFHDLPSILGSLTTLFVIGLTLGYARRKTASLWLPIGLHAGWILGASVGSAGWVKLTKRSISTAPWFGGDLLNGLAPVVVLTVTGVAVWLFLQKSPRSRGETPVS